MQRLGSWNSSFGPDHSRVSLRLAQIKFCFFNSPVSTQFSFSTAVQSHSHRINTVEMVRDKGLALPFFREKQILAYCLMKKTPSFYICFVEMG